MKKNSLQLVKYSYIFIHILKSPAVTILFSLILVFKLLIRNLG